MSYDSVFTHPSRIFSPHAKVTIYVFVVSCYNKVEGISRLEVKSFKREV